MAIDWQLVPRSCAVELGTRCTCGRSATTTTGMHSPRASSSFRRLQQRILLRFLLLLPSVLVVLLRLLLPLHLPECSPSLRSLLHDHALGRSESALRRQAHAPRLLVVHERHGRPVLGEAGVAPVHDADDHERHPRRRGRRHHPVPRARVGREGRQEAEAVGHATTRRGDGVRRARHGTDGTRLVHHARQVHAPILHHQPIDGHHQVCGDTFVFGPVCLWLFFSSVSVMEGTPWETIRRKMWRDFVPTYLIDYSFWPIVQGLNFSFVPVRHQLMCVNIVCFFDDIFLTYVQHNELPRIFVLVEEWWERFYEKNLLKPGEKMEDIFFEDEDD